MQIDLNSPLKSFVQTSLRSVQEWILIRMPCNSSEVKTTTEILCIRSQLKIMSKITEKLFSSLKLNNSESMNSVVDEMR